MDGGSTLTPRRRMECLLPRRRVRVSPRRMVSSLCPYGVSVVGGTQGYSAGVLRLAGEDCTGDTDGGGLFGLTRAICRSGVHNYNYVVSLRCEDLECRNACIARCP